MLVDAVSVTPALLAKVEIFASKTFISGLLVKTDILEIEVFFVAAFS